jgi:hypothetical protein
MFLHSIPKVDECVVDVFVQGDEKFESNSNASIGRYFAQRRWVYSRVKRNWAMLVQCICPRLQVSCVLLPAACAVLGIVPFRDEEQPVKDSFPGYVERVMFVRFLVMHSQ